MNAIPLTPGRIRDARLDFFRGVTMLIIFIAHMPGNSWNGFIPARFGFSSGAELFVFCSGIASAFAFGPTFSRFGMAIGTARIAQRIWQVYWAEICLVMALATLAALSDVFFDLGMFRGQFGPLLDDPKRAILGLVTLTWQPDLLDILPMYIVILALIPLAMALGRVHPVLPLFVSCVLYGLVWSVGLNLPGNPWSGAGWFLNPFAWQLIFFVGFSIAMRWLSVPPLGVSSMLVASSAILAASLPLSFWIILDHWPAARAVHDMLLAPDEKTNLHPLRVIHFLATAYVTLSLIEPWREQLTTGVGRVLVKIGQQSLAAFLASVVLARLGSIAVELSGGSELTIALVNLAGFGALFAVAATVQWFKSAPWSPKRQIPPNPRQDDTATVAGCKAFVRDAA